MKNTDVAQLVGELGAGVMEETLSVILSDVASAVIETKKVGEVLIRLKFKAVGSNDQLNIQHTVAYKKPKKRGSIAEDDTQESVMYVNEGGNITQFPENQMDMLGMPENKETTKNAD